MSTIRTEFAGGLASAIPGLVHALTLGMLAFAALGPDHAEVGIRAGFAAVIFGGAAAALISGTSLPATGPRASVSLILAAFVLSLTRDPALDTAAITGLAALCVAAAGAIQIVFGVLRLGTVAKFVPYPVVAGFMCGVALLIALNQLPLLGWPAGAAGSTLANRLAQAQPLPMMVGLTTAVSIWVIGYRWKRLPAALLGLSAGTAVHFALAAAAPQASLGLVVGSLAPGLPMPESLSRLAELAGSSVATGHLRNLINTAVVIAVIGALDSLLAAVAIDAVAGTRHRANQELIAQGLGNIVSALFGGVPVALSPARAIPAYRAGGKTRAVGLIAAALLAAVPLALTPLIAYLPLAVLAGVMLTVAWGLVDSWTRSMLRRLATGARDPGVAWSTAVVLLVAATTVLANFVVAVTAGVFLSMALFIAAINRSLVRAVYDGSARPSRRIYGPEHARVLTEARRRIRVVELEGALFFGSTERLGDQVESLVQGGRYVVLDLSRITAIDATGAIALAQIVRRAATSGARVLLAGVSAHGRHGVALIAYGTFTAADAQAWFTDADHAIEHAERALLGEFVAAPEIPLNGLALAEGLAPDELEVLRGMLRRDEISAGQTLFREGEAGDRLYVLARGAVAISIAAVAGAGPRIVTFAPGAIFGEAAMLDGRARSATAVAVEDAAVYVMTRSDLDAVVLASPQMGFKILANLGRHLSARLRHTTDTLREFSDTRG